MYWKDVSLFPIFSTLSNTVWKYPGIKNFKDGKETRIFLTRLVIYIIIIIEYWGKIVIFLRGIEVEASKMFFRSCHERGTKKKFWVHMRNQTSDLQIPRSDALSPSLLFIFDKLTICACNSGLYWTLRPRFNGCLLLR